MVDVEKVIAGLKKCVCGEPSCNGCPYDISSSKCLFLLHTDALELLKEQNQKICDLLCKQEGLQEVVHCKDCKYHYVDGDNVNMCLLNHNKVQSDDWFCADGERKDN